MAYYLAQKLGVNRIEKNRTEPHMTTIRKLADTLEVDPAELVRGE
jgi:transcriptional regulator with XRE-family HTH domain